MTLALMATLRLRMIEPAGGFRLLTGDRKIMHSYWIGLARAC